jgi:hypothetical protein
MLFFRLLVVTNWYFWIYTWTLMVVALVGLGATIMLMIVLRFTTKMESIEFLTDSDLTKLMGNIDLDEIYKSDGIMEGFKDIPLEIASDNENIFMHVINPEDKSKFSDFYRIMAMLMYSNNCHFFF